MTKARFCIRAASATMLAPAIALAIAATGCAGSGSAPSAAATTGNAGGADAALASGAGDATSPSEGGDAALGAPEAEDSLSDARGAGARRGPTPPTATDRFPFPQNRESSRCTYPAGYDNEDVVLAYQQWKNDTVTASGAGNGLRIQRPESQAGLAPGSTVSEGIGYGMLIAVMMDDQSLFDGLWKYERQWLDAAGLMNWYILGDGSGVGPKGSGGATDADEDMAFALVLADKQWGGQGSLSEPYRQYAIDQIQSIWKAEIQDSKLPKPGEWGGWSTVNISYFAPAYYRVFAALDPPDAWGDVVKTVYDTIDYAVTAANGNQNNGLVPAWCDDSHGSPCVPEDLGIANDTGYQYDSCRTPFRIGLDWCWNGEPRAQKYLALTSAFFGAIGAQKVADTYALNGSPQPLHPGGHSAAFVGAAGVGAMSAPAYGGFVGDAYAAVATRTYLAGGTYYEDSWTVMSLLMMTGSFLDYTRL